MTLDERLQKAAQEVQDQFEALEPLHLPSPATHRRPRLRSGPVAAAAAFVTVAVIGATLLWLGPFASPNPDVANEIGPQNDLTPTTLSSDNPISDTPTTASTTTTLPTPTTTSIQPPEVTTPIPVEPRRGDGPFTRSCPAPGPLPAEHHLEQWVVTIHSQVGTLVDDMNTMGRAVDSAGPHASGWVDAEAVASAVDAVLADLALIEETSHDALKDAGMTLDSNGFWVWSEDLEGGPIFYLPEGIWSKARTLQWDVMPNFLATTGTQDVIDYYNNGAVTAGPCGTTLFMVQAVGYITRDALAAP